MLLAQKQVYCIYIYKYTLYTYLYVYIIFTFTLPIKIIRMAYNAMATATRIDSIVSDYYYLYYSTGDNCDIHPSQ